MRNTKSKRILIYTLAFLIPIVILLFAYYFTGIFPFGDKSILYRDLKGQYVSYFSAFRNAILGNGSLLYSFTKGFGGNMFGIVTYYLISPFNIIILLFPKDLITEAILLMTILKIATCGLTFMIFLQYTFKKINYKSLIFSTAYALMAFNIVYQSNIMWLDVVYLLPLVMMGIHKLVNGESKVLYVVTLAFSIMSNFYMGFMICIFSVIYFIYITVTKIREENLEGKFFIRRGIPFVITSIISGALSLVIILPTIYALQDGKSVFLFFTQKWMTNFSLFDLISRMYINKVNDLSILIGLPNIYTGLLVMMLVFLFYFNGRIKLFNKISASVVIFIFLISMYINKIDYIWQGFNKPIGYPYRYSFILSFFILTIAYTSFLKIKELKVRYVLVVFVVFSGLLLLFWDKNSYIVDKTLSITNLPKSLIVTNLIFIIIYTIGLIMVIREKFSDVVMVIMSLVFFVEVGINGYNTFSNLPYAKRANFQYYMKDVGQVMDGIQNTDKGFYREDTNFSFNANDSMLLNYRGLSHFSSMYKVDLKYMVQSFGFINNDYWTYYGTGSTLSANTLMNFKYVVKDNNLPIPGYKFIKSEKGLYIFENQYYLNMGFVVSDKTLNTNVEPKNNPFNTQNAILNNMTNGQYQRVYYPINNFKLANSNSYVTKYSYGTKFVAKNTNKPVGIKIEFYAQNNNPIYIFAQGAANVYVNGQKVSGYSDYKLKTFALGQFETGQKVTVRIYPIGNSFMLERDGISYLNMYEYTQVYNELKQNQFNVTSFNDRQVNGTITIPQNGEMLYTTIPYDKGWSLYVNGKKTDYEKVFGALIGVKLKPGTYKIAFDFIPRGLVFGGTVSLITLILCIIYESYGKKKILSIKNRNKRAYFKR